MQDSLCWIALVTIHLLYLFHKSCSLYVHKEWGCLQRTKCRVFLQGFGGRQGRYCDAVSSLHKASSCSNALKRDLGRILSSHFLQSLGERGILWIKNSESHFPIIVVIGVSIDFIRCGGPEEWIIQDQAAYLTLHLGKISSCLQFESAHLAQSARNSRFRISSWFRKKGWDM